MKKKVLLLALTASAVHAANETPRALALRAIEADKPEDVFKYYSEIPSGDRVEQEEVLTKFVHKWLDSWQLNAEERGQLIQIMWAFVNTNPGSQFEKNLSSRWKRDLSRNYPPFAERFNMYVEPRAPSTATTSSSSSAAQTASTSSSAAQNNIVRFEKRRIGTAFTLTKTPALLAIAPKISPGVDNTFTLGISDEALEVLRETLSAAEQAYAHTKDLNATRDAVKKTLGKPEISSLANSNIYELIEAADYLESIPLQHAFVVQLARILIKNKPIDWEIPKAKLSAQSLELLKRTLTPAPPQADLVSKEGVKFPIAVDVYLERIAPRLAEELAKNKSVQINSSSEVVMLFRAALAIAQQTYRIMHLKDPKIAGFPLAIAMHNDIVAQMEKMPTAIQNIYELINLAATYKTLILREAFVAILAKWIIGQKQIDWQSIKTAIGVHAPSLALQLYLLKGVDTEQFFGIPLQKIDFQLLVDHGRLPPTIVALFPQLAENPMSIGMTGKTFIDVVKDQPWPVERKIYVLKALLRIKTEPLWNTSQVRQAIAELAGAKPGAEASGGTTSSSSSSSTAITTITPQIQAAFAEFGLPTTATADDVKQAWKKLVLVRHPDKGGTQEGFKKLGEAYEVLKKYLNIK